MTRLFSDIPEAIANTRIISDRLGFSLDNLGYQFPHYPVGNNETMDSFLAKRVAEGRAQTLWQQRQAQVL